jgi:hypothetical protein
LLTVGADGQCRSVAWLKKLRLSDNCPLKDA